MAQHEHDFSQPAGFDPGPIIIGVDIGLTYTKVAFCSARDPKIVTIKTWPGTKKIDSKVPTALAYRAGVMKAQSYGYSCFSRESEGILLIKDLFKLFLDKKELDKVYHAGQNEAQLYGSHGDVQRWLKDFLEHLYEHIRETVCRKWHLRSWKHAPVHFVFSVPTLWEGGPVATDFKNIAKEAGFGAEGRSHSVEFDLNEAEAAAIYTVRHSKEQYLKYLGEEIPEDENVNQVVCALTEAPSLKEGENILVVDSGGGTTDIATLMIKKIKRLLNDNGEEEIIPELNTLPFIGDPSQNAVGSVHIDEIFKKAVVERLHRLPPGYFLRQFPLHAARNVGNAMEEIEPVRPEEITLLRGKIARVADEMVRGAFQEVKEGFGSKSFEFQLNFPFKVPIEPRLTNDFNHRDARIENGCLVFERDEIAALFDKQFFQICNLINAQLGRPEQITRVILSGGLGSSHYIQKKIFEEYGSGVGGKQILASDNPQLAVCRGLVLDRLHRLKYDQNILSARPCGASYGIIYNKQLGHMRHRMIRMPSPLYKTLADGNSYAVKHVYWFIKKGQKIPRSTSVSYHFRRTIIPAMLNRGPADSTVDFTDEIVMSGKSPDQLPSTLNDRGVGGVGRIKSKLPKHSIAAASTSDSSSTSSSTPISHKKRRIKFLHRVPEHWSVVLNLRMLVESAGLRFEMWCGHDLIGGPLQVPVNWLYAATREDVDSDTDSISTYLSGDEGLLGQSSTSIHGGPGALNVLV